MAASGKIFLRVLEALVVVSLLFLCHSFRFRAAGSGLRRKTSPSSRGLNSSGTAASQRDTLLARIFSRAGDLYSEEAVRRDFQALWNTQFFEDIRLEVEDDPDQPERESGRFLRDRAAHHPPDRVQGE